VPGPQDVTPPVNSIIMPLARAVGIKARAHDPAPGQPRSLWQVFQGTSGNLEPEAARFIAKQTGRHPVTGKPLPGKQKPGGVSVDMSDVKRVGDATCICPTNPTPVSLPPASDCVVAAVGSDRQLAVRLSGCLAVRRRGEATAAARQHLQTRTAQPLSAHYCLSRCAWSLQL
jgi:hypothetical protein